MNTAAKGRRLEHRSRRLLEASGYLVVRAAASKGPFDLVGIGSTDLVLLQVKANRPPAPAEREALALVAVPANCRKLVHVWPDHARVPVVTIL